MSAFEAVAARIRREGTIGFDAFMAIALYGDEGFFTRARGAGTDFVTSPQVGSLFGRLVARAIDAEWQRLGEPDPFVVIDCGAGDGSLARSVLQASPACAPALRYVLVETSAALRERQRDRLALEPPDEALGPFMRGATDADAPEPVAGSGPVVTHLDDLPALTVDGVVLANELLDNLPLRIVERTATGWAEVHVGLAGSPAAETLTEVLVPLPDDASLARTMDARTAHVDPPPGTRLPVPDAAVEWVHRAVRTLRRGAVVLVDYFATTDELVARSPDWLRTYRGQRRADGAAALDAPGDHDITADVWLDPILAAALEAGAASPDVMFQSEWLRVLGVDDDVVAARHALDTEHTADPRALDALRHRSTVTEAAQLGDPSGLGAHRVVRLQRHRH